MGFNQDYEAIGKSFTEQYYAMFDNAQTRPNLLGLYHATDSMLTFEGVQCQGGPKIIEKFMGLSFKEIQHVITSVDCQPMFDGGIIINVIGQLKTDDDPPHTFSQTFALKHSPDSDWFCQHDIFRLGIHNTI